VLSDDAYRREIDAVIEKLGAWAAANRDFAHVIEERNALYWRLAVAPHVPGACRFELILRSDRRFDVVIGAETYEDRTVERFDDFVSLPIAVSEGRVITRTWFSAGTGARHTVETIVDLGTSAFTGVRPIEPTASHMTREACIAHDRHWLAYRR
jgi:hypothetical protein